MKNDIVFPQGNWKEERTDAVKPLSRKNANIFNKIALAVIRKTAKVKDDLNVFKTLLYLKANMLFYVLFFNSVYKKGTIPQAEKEKIIFRIAWKTGSTYEYVHHFQEAKKIGVTLDDIMQLCTENVQDTRLHTLCACADDLIANQQISTENLAKLKEIYSDNQIVEFCMLVGHYVMVAGLNNSLVSLEKD